MKGNYDFAEMANKFVLSLDEAVHFYGIGEKRLRKLIQDNEGEPWVLMVGNRYHIKRPAFEKWLETVNNL